MKLLVLSFYYPPDLSAGSFRTNHLVQAIRKADRRCEVTVLTTAPNRYHSFRFHAPDSEDLSQLHIRRISLPTHRGGFLSQSRAFAVYAAQVMQLAKHLDFDAVFATSSRLMTAALGARVARRGGVPLYLDIRDIFPDTIGDVLPYPLSSMMKPLFEAIESYAIRAAASVNVVSEGFCPYFSHRYPGQRITVFTNGIDPEFIDPLPAGDDGTTKKGPPIRIVYAGNMGDGQGLHAIVPDLAKRLADEAVFDIIGDGGRRADLCRAVHRAGCSNVHIHEPVTRVELRAAYEKADVLFLHLNDYEAFAKVLPSKIFEYAATGRPILAGVRGFAATFLRTEVPNAEVFHPCDAIGARDALHRLRLGPTPRTEFVERYARETVCRKMADDIIAVLSGYS